MTDRKRIVLISLLILAGSSFVFSQETVRVGALAPDFELQDATGKSFKLSEYRGRSAVVLEFFRSGSW